jgi:hypothetical protein
MAVRRIVCGAAAVLAITCVALGVLRAQSTPASAPWSHPRTAGRSRYRRRVDERQQLRNPARAVLDLAPQKDLYEYDCHEGNRGLENILRAARFEEARAAERDRGR